MVTHCELPTGKRGTTCPRCGFVLPWDTPHPPKRICEPPQEDNRRRKVANKSRYCIHLGEPLGQNVEAIKTKGCKTSRPMTAVFECELYGECTPLAESKIVRSCCSCPSFQLPG